MKIISWNVAGLRACYKKGLEEFFLSELPDMFCMQETKVLEKENPLHIEGYKEYLYPAEKKGYSGTMIYSKIEPLSIKYGIGIEEFDSEGRVITLEYDNFYLVNAYVPNSKRELERLNERMYFEDEMRKYLKNLNKNVIYCGDLNVAHEEIDIKNAKTNTRSAGFTIEERNKMTELFESGFIDTFRYLYPDAIKYSWWSYMGGARAKNVGWRLDYFIVNNEYINKVKDSLILNEIMGSDHCPIKLIIEE
ncbi:MAG: exodeoxyribonuclease III [Tenericutes bacterium]|nr:exodeoxyribonuclease III [Mycoplasmatota bacterium]